MISIYTKPRNDLTGKNFGRLLVVSFHHREFHKKKTILFYLCKCSCGVEKIIQSSSLLRKLTVSCGCYRIEKVSESGKLRRTDGRLISAKQMWKNSYSDGCSFEKFIELSQHPCYYCGTSLSNKFNSYITAKDKLKIGVSKEWGDQSWFYYNGLDRLDSNLAHTEDNIVPCCKYCNYAKREMPLDKFREWARRLNNNMNKKKW